MQIFRFVLYQTKGRERFRSLFSPVEGFHAVFKVSVLNLWSLVPCIPTHKLVRPL